MQVFIINPFTLIKPGERPSTSAWIQFVLTVGLIVGAGLLLAGIIFFFAYNWDGLSRLTKLCIVAAATTALGIGAMCCRSHSITQKLLLTGVSVMTGVLIAVYGQSYQLQSDSGFLAWALCILIWTIVADFDVLWLIFIAVLQTGIAFRFVQEEIMLQLTFLAFISLFVLLPRYWNFVHARSPWFTNTLLTLAALFCIYMIIYSKFMSWDKSRQINDWGYLLSFLAIAIFCGLKLHNLYILALGLLTIIVKIQTEILMEGHDQWASLILTTVSIALFVWLSRKLKQDWNYPTETSKDNNNGDSK